MISHISSDIRAEYASTLTLKIILKSIFNPSIHAVILVRLCAATSGWLHSLLRNVLIFKHSIDVASGAVIGSGLKMPHPFSIVIGKDVEIGNNVTIYQSVTLGKKNGYPRICDDVIIYPNSVIVGKINIGSKAIIGANSFVDKDLPVDSVYKSR